MDGDVIANNLKILIISLDGRRGISTFAGCTITNNISYNNHSHGILANGESCTVTGNTVWNNGDIGIAVEGCCSTVTGNTAYNNNTLNKPSNAGIRVYNSTLLRGNTVTNNTRNNILIMGAGNTIEENLVTRSTNGIYFNHSGNFYDNNRASANGTDYTNIVGSTDGGGNVSF